MAGTLGGGSQWRRFSRNEWKQVDIVRTCDHLQSSERAPELRTAAGLVVGLSRIHSHKCLLYMSDVTHVYHTLRRLMASAVQSAQTLEQPLARIDAITLQAAPKAGALDLPLDVPFSLARSAQLVSAASPTPVTPSPLLETYQAPSASLLTTPPAPSPVRSRLLSESPLAAHAIGRFLPLTHEPSSAGPTPPSPLAEMWSLGPSSAHSASEGFAEPPAAMSEDSLGTRVQESQERTMRANVLRVFGDDELRFFEDLARESTSRPARRLSRTQFAVPLASPSERFSTNAPSFASTATSPRPSRPQRLGLGGTLGYLSPRMSSEPGHGGSEPDNLVMPSLASSDAVGASPPRVHVSPQAPPTPPRALKRIAAVGRRAHRRVGRPGIVDLQQTAISRGEQRENLERASLEAILDAARQRGDRQRVKRQRLALEMLNTWARVPPSAPILARQQRLVDPQLVGRSVVARATSTVSSLVALPSATTGIPAESPVGLEPGQSPYSTFLGEGSAAGFMSPGASETRDASTPIVDDMEFVLRGAAEGTRTPSSVELARAAEPILAPWTRQSAASGSTAQPGRTPALAPAADFSFDDAPWRVVLPSPSVRAGSSIGATPGTPGRRRGSLDSRAGESNLPFAEPSGPVWDGGSSPSVPSPGIASVVAGSAGWAAGLGSSESDERQQQQDERDFMAYAVHIAQAARTMHVFFNDLAPAHSTGRSVAARAFSHGNVI